MELVRQMCRNFCFEAVSNDWRPSSARKSVYSYNFADFVLARASVESSVTGTTKSSGFA